MNDWSEYVNSLTQGAPQDEVGKRIGIAGSTVSRWRSGKRPGNPAEVASLATNYGGNVLEAFVAAGYLTPEQAGTTPIPPLDLSEVEPTELANEVTRRLVEGLQPVLKRFEQISEKVGELERRRQRIAESSDLNDSMEEAALDAEKGVDEESGGSEDRV